jgi:hypothetical protein
MDVSIDREIIKTSDRTATIVSIKEIEVMMTMKRGIVN